MTACTVTEMPDAGGGQDSPVERADVRMGTDAPTPDAPRPDAESCRVLCGPSLSCCASGEECIADRCLPACAGARCGADDALCCTGENLCVGGACIPPGAVCVRDDECPADQNCEPLVGRCIPVPMGSDGCSYRPPTGVFEPELQWEWTGGNVMVAPIVIQTNDDDGDGRVGPSDTPDVVVVAYDGIGPAGRVVALSGDDGRLLWESSGLSVCRLASPAAADIDADGEVEIVALTDCGSMGEVTAHVVAFSADGTLEWTSTETTHAYYDAIAIADLDGAPDGHAEIVAGQGVFSSTGALLWTARELGLGHFRAPLIANLDADPQLEVVTGGTAFHHDGTVLWRSGAPSGTIALGNLMDGTTGPQIVGVSGTAFTIVDGLTGATLLGPIAFETPSSPFFMWRSGPPTIADFDGDGDREIGLAGDERYLVLDPDGTAADRVLWSRPSEDLTVGSVGTTVFDFDADGRAEVLYNDECILRILDGRTGAELWWTPNTSGTLMEYPIVVDVDNDGNAELVAVANAPPTLRCDGMRRMHPHTLHFGGVRVFRDRLDNWVPTRTVWNEHTYHVSNIEEDGSLPATEGPSWSTHNTFRLNTLPDPNAAFYAPDLVAVSVGGNGSLCPDRVRVYTRIENRGARGVAAGVEVAFYAGTPTSPGALLGVGRTATTLLAGAGVSVELDLAMPMLDMAGRLGFFAVVDDDGTGRGQHSECIEDNNTSDAVSFDCSGPF